MQKRRLTQWSGSISGRSWDVMVLALNTFIDCRCFSGAPRTWVRTNDWLSETFSPHRGMRQGYPVTLFICSGIGTPGYFNQAILQGQRLEGRALGGEAVLICERCPALFEWCGSVSHSDPLTLGSFSGIRINLSKSILFPIDDRSIDLAPSSPLQSVEEFRYLGVQVTKHISEFFDRNLHPPLTSLKTRC